MASLSEEELECLHLIDCGKSCSDAVLIRLERMELIERNPLVIMPQLPQGFGRRTYHLTPQGRAALSGRGAE
ncbi:MAG: hypothetical protein WA970_22185 [Gammaproteobacteria bacterium]|jgi:hypothetical protein|nr:hypothetical protein [Gammaproteobacteria bacterium]